MTLGSVEEIQEVSCSFENRLWRVLKPVKFYNVFFIHFVQINSLQFPSGKYVSKEENSSNTELPPFELRGANKNVQRPVKKQRFSDASNAAANNGDASSDSDKEQKLTAYYASAIALSNTPEEKKRRENRSKRFEKRTEVNHVRSKNNGVGNFYSRRASASVLSKNYDDGGNKAVEDMDWDALTVKGTSQEIEKRYLRLTSAPDPATVITSIFLYPFLFFRVEKSSVVI